MALAGGYLSARQSNRNSDNDQSRDDGTNWYPEEPTDLGNCLESMGRRGRQDRVVAAEGSTCSLPHHPHPHPGVDIRPCLFNEFDQTTLETQPLARKRIGRLALGADLADQLDKSRGLGHAAI